MMGPMGVQHIARKVREALQYQQEDGCVRHARLSAAAGTQTLMCCSHLASPRKLTYLVLDLLTLEGPLRLSLSAP
jgi:hypothetical protein